MLIIIHLRGGADGLNMVIPYRQDAYFRARPTIAIPREQVIALGATGLHPAFAPLLPAYGQGDVAFVAGVGLPNATLSHFEARDDVESGGVGDTRPVTGWLARWLEMQPDVRALLPVVVFGETLPRILFGATGACVIRRLSDLKLSAKSAQFGQSLRRLYAHSTRRAAARGVELLDALESLDVDAKGDAPSAGYPATAFGEQLYGVELLSRAGLTLAASIELDGWDTHIAQGATEGLQAQLISTLASGLANFHQRLGDGLRLTRVIVMTEFGRRVAENNSGGTDHGRASVALVIGSGIGGGKIHGDWGSLEPSRLDGDGNVAPSVDLRQVVAEALGWVQDGPRLAAVFPGFQPSHEVGLGRA